MVCTVNTQRGMMMQTVKWEYYPLVALNTLTRAFVEELAQVRRSPSTVDNYSRDLEDFLQALVDVPFPAVLEADETLIARYLDSLWNRPARRGSGHKLSREHVTLVLSVYVLIYQFRPACAVTSLTLTHGAREVTKVDWLVRHHFHRVLPV